MMNDDKEKYSKMMETQHRAHGSRKQLTGKPLTKGSTQIWINAAYTLLAMIVMRLPSPSKAQEHRVENFFKGPMDDTAANDDVRVQVVPTSDEGRVYAIGSKEDLNIKSIQQGRATEQITDVPGGNTVALVGVY